MKYNIGEKILTLYFEGRIDSANAPETEEKALSELQLHANEYSSVVIDVKDLQYISSAGLRVILKIRKANPSLKIIGASPEVYDIFEMTGFTEMMPIERAYREFKIDGCEKLGEGSNGIVYRYDPEIVIKVYRNPDAFDDINRERNLARKALILGIPTAIPFDVVKVGDKYASVFELLNAKSFSKLIKSEPQNIDKYTALFAELLKQIHSTEVSPDDMPSIKETVLEWAKFLKGHIPDEQAEKLFSLIENVPERHTMIHGDYHTNNVEMQNGEVLLIDMDTLAYGHPVFELGSMYLGFCAFGELDPKVIEKFLGISSDVAGYIWKKTLSLYLDTTDENEIGKIEEKAKIIAYTRLLRRTLRRDPDTEHGKQQIALCKKNLGELISKVEALYF